MSAAERAPRQPTDLSAIKEVLEKVGVEHRNVWGVAERALVLDGGTVLRFDLDGRYLGATSGDDAPVPRAQVSAVEEDCKSPPIYIGGDAQADETTALLPTRREIAGREEGKSPAADGTREDLERLAGLLPAGGPLLVEGGTGGGVRNFSGAGSDLRLVELWLSGKSEASRRAYLSDLTKFFSVVNEDAKMGDLGTHRKALKEITLSDLHRFAETISELWAPRTQVRMLAAVKSLFTYAQKTGYLPFNVGAALELPGVKDDLAERELTELEVHDLLNAPRSPRDRALLLLLYAGGLRREDVCALKWRDLKARDDVRPGAGQITVFGKGGKTGNVLLPPSVFRRLLAIRGEDATDEDPVFASRKKKTARRGHLDPSQVNRIVKAAAKRANLQNAERVSPHWLRHSHATHADRKGAPLPLIRDTLRHASIATTGRYLHANPTESSAMYLGL